MAQISTRLPDELVQELEQAAKTLNRSRAEVVRQAIEHYLDDFEDLELAMQRLRDPTDAVLDWEQVKRDLLATD
ncbi:MAG: CopG family transcriptional regulator [Gammaproteobacteria bacterium]|nr:MAG: CopG family transcriptional regulator [Gammaproteobacteria bacterium]